MITAKVPPEATERVKEDTFVMDEPGLSLGLLEVLQKALAQEPEERPQSIAEFQEMLKKAEDSLAVRYMETITYVQPSPLEESEQIRVTEPAAESELLPKPKRERQKFPGWLRVTAAMVLALALIIVFRPETTPKNQKPASANPENTQSDRLYAEITNDADKLFNQGNYQEAKLKYEQALVLKPGDSFITGKIEACKQKISDLEKEAEKERLYAKYTDEGNRLFNRGSYKEAKLQYEQSLAQKPGDIYATDKVEQCNQQISDLEAKAEKDRLYTKYQNEGNTLSKQGNYAEAKQRFQQALKYKPRDTYIVGLIAETDRLLKQAAKTIVPAGMVKIPAGAFMMGSNDGDSDEKPVHKVSVDAFYMDKYEVTVEKYEKFLKAKGHRKPANWSYQLQQPKCPVVFVSWEDAMAYSKWRGKRLPTEAEWEYAARGGNTGLNGKPIYKYSWGNDIDKSKANYGNPFSSDWSNGAGKYLKDVGSYSKNGFGLYDMAGNVWEWCSDRYDENYYQTSSGRNPKGPSSGTRRVLRGGSWYDDPNLMRCAYRYRNFPTYRSYNYGFRCVRDVL